MSVKCYKCGTDLSLTPNQNIARSEDCDKCGCDLRCCKMCQFYDSNSYNECKEPVADRIVEKEKANYCDYFKLGTSSTAGDNQKSALDAANALFKK